MLSNFLKSKKKRSRETSSPRTTSLSLLNEITGRLNCCNFIYPNEHFDKTLGLLAVVLQKSVGDINFSDIFNEAEEHDELESPTDLIALLENKRENLKDIDVSIEKCLILNKSISYADENKIDFMTTVSKIRTDMKTKMTDNEADRTLEFPKDFRKREDDILKRKKAHDMRRLFHQNHVEAKEPPNIIHLNNRTTEHLIYLINRMKFDSKFRDTGIAEIIKILNTSFMIIAQPHHDVNPVLIYERQEHGIYKAKVSVTIISLLHDFMQTYPNTIELYHIEPSLSPASPHYKLLEPQSISWNVCQLQACSNEKPQMIQYAELSSITIEQTNRRDAHVHFAQALHSFKFNIGVHINLPDHRLSKTHSIPLESLQFAIGNHSNQIPQLLTRIILNDIRIIANPKLDNIEIIRSFILSYFEHRTGVEPKNDLHNYLRQELTKAYVARKNFQTLEDIYMDFLVPFVYQIEFMGRHPILPMFYTEGLFLGSCDSSKVAEVLENSPDINSSKIALRFNSIALNYKSVANKSVSGRIIKYNPCAVRVDIYNSSATKIQNRTFNPNMLINDISKFVYSSSLPNANRISILSDLNEKTYKSYDEFKTYYHPRLDKICVTNEKYQLITDIIDNVKIEDDEEVFDDGVTHDTDSDDSCVLKSQSTGSISSTTFDSDQHINVDTVSNYETIPYDDHNNNQPSSDNVVTVTRQELIQYILADSELLTELMYHMKRLNLITSPQQPQYLYQQSTMMMSAQFSEPIIYQQQLTKQQENSSINFYQPNNTNQSQIRSMHDINDGSQQRSTQVEVLELFGDDLTQLIANNFELITTDQTPVTLTDEDIPLSLDDSIRDLLSSQDRQ